MSVATLVPPSVPRLTGTPFLQRTATSGEPKPQLEPTTSPAGLMAKASLPYPPGSVPRSVIAPSLHRNAWVTPPVGPSNELAPTTSPRALMSFAQLLLMPVSRPPTSGSAPRSVITPSRHRKAWRNPGRYSPLQPTTSPRELTAVASLLQQPGKAMRRPRSVNSPFSQRKAWKLCWPTISARPTTTSEELIARGTIRLNSAVVPSSIVVMRIALVAAPAGVPAVGGAVGLSAH